jgi:hypothetical protein
MRHVVFALCVVTSLVVGALIGPSASADDEAHQTAEPCVSGCRAKAALQVEACIEKNGDASQCEADHKGWARLCVAAYCPTEKTDACTLRLKEDVRACLDDKKDAATCRQVAASSRQACEDGDPSHEQTCADQCGVDARAGMPACVEETGSRKECGLAARERYAVCVEQCP